MQVINKSSYISTIYSAVVVNTNKDLDPDDLGRVQIYIPSVNYNYADSYIEYMTSENKTSNSELFEAFPWAVTLIDDLNNGDEIYGSYIDGDSTQYIILGVSKSKKTINTAGALNNNIMINGSSVTDLAMSVILHNEIGVAISDWGNDTIPDSKYSSITLHDGGTYNNSTGQWVKQGCWSIGLIQWNGVRAYDLCFNIAKNTTNWENIFTANVQLKDDLKISLMNDNTSNQRSKYGNGFNPEKGGSTYNSIKALINSDSGKKTQKQIAYNDTNSTINMLYEQGCNNPAILIYMADFYNQYGSGYSQTTKKCVEACSKSGDLITQLDWLIENQLKPNFSSFNTYSNRRNTTYNYIKDLYNNGAFNNTLTTEGVNSNNIYISGTGQYCIPFVGSYSITAQWGKAGYSGGYTGYSSGAGHSGIDFGCPTGTKLLACTNGVIEKTAQLTNSYGTHVYLRAEDGNLIIYAHMSNFVVQTGDRVTKGQLIGHSGNTGHSSGDHLHFEIRPTANGDFSESMWGSTNPAPYLGISGHTNDMVYGA